MGPTEHCRKKCLALDAILRRLHRSAVVGAVIAPIALACRGGEPFSRSGHGREPGAQGTRAGGETVMVEAVALVPVARLGVARGVALSIAEQRRHAIVGTWFLPVQAHAHTRILMAAAAAAAAATRGRVIGALRAAACPLSRQSRRSQLQFALKHASSQ